MRTRTLALVAAVGAACAAAVASANTLPDFRVRPYLMSPTTSGMTINWFTTANAAGTLTVTGPGLSEPVQFTSTPELRTDLNYSTTEENNRASNPDMFANNANFKHSVTVAGLQADAVYTYTVVQGGSTFEGTFRTAPEAGANRPIRLAVFSDSETLVSGRTTRRGWTNSPQGPGSTGTPAGLPNSNVETTTRGYVVTEQRGYAANIDSVQSRNPELIVMPGDLIQGNGNEAQRRWDEFWRHNAGEYDTLLSQYPLVAAIGNNCIFYNSWTNNTTIQAARRQWSAYFDFPANGNAAFQDLYHRQDYGPITIITLCSVKGVSPDNHLVALRDTNRAWNQLYTFGDVPDANPFLDAARTIESEQYQWARAQLADARAKGQVIFVQWHHTPYSSGIHGSQTTSNQSGEAMRQWTPLLEEFRVAGVFAGHSEVPERSFVDADNDGYGINYWDVGNAGDGLRGVESAFGNPAYRWTSDQNEPEVWNGNRLVSGGKHYGFLEVDVEPLGNGNFRVTLRPWHTFPLLDGSAQFNVTGFELREYNDLVVLEGPANSLQRVNPESCRVDYNFDGELTFDDVQGFITRYNTGSPVSAGRAPGADLNFDGEFTFDDIQAFVRLFNQGC
jgi:hypothetical protein